MNNATPSKGTEFIPLIGQAFEHAVNYVLAGFFITLALCALSLVPGAFGMKAFAILQGFVEHTTPSPTPFIPAFFLLGISAAFSPSELADFIRKRIAHPATQLAAHSLAVVFGVLAALLVAALFIADIRHAASSLALALAIALIAYFELSLVLVYTEGKFDALFAANKWARRILNAFGIAFAIFSADALVTQLPEPKSHRTKPCAVSATSAASSAER
jgi:hypothetical protein